MKGRASYKGQLTPGFGYFLGEKSFCVRFPLPHIYCMLLVSFTYRVFVCSCFTL